MAKYIARIYEELKIVLTKKGEIYSYDEECRIRRMLPCVTNGNLEFYRGENNAFIFIKASCMKDFVSDFKDEKVGFFDNYEYSLWRPVSNLKDNPFDKAS